MSDEKPSEVNDPKKKEIAVKPAPVNAMEDMDSLEDLEDHSFSEEQEKAVNNKQRRDKNFPRRNNNNKFKDRHNHNNKNSWKKLLKSY